MATFSKKNTKFISSTFVCLLVIIFVNLPISKGVYSENWTPDTLRLVHVLYRHGDRAPVSFYKNDPHQSDLNKYWPEGLGQLTKKGKAMEYALGSWLRKRYQSFVSNKFVPEEMNVLSTDIDRTLMSAQCVLASFYYPDNKTRFNDELSWMPTPIHTAPLGADKVLNVDAACPRITLETAKMEALPKVKNYLQKHKEFFHYLSVQSGEPLETVLSVEFLFDTLKIERDYNLTLPFWANEKFEDLRKVGQFSFAMLTLTQELKVLRGGPLVSLMTRNMVQKSHDTLPDKKMFMFSAHDSTVATLLDTLGVYNYIEPPYAATVIVELHEIEGKHVVKAFYQNDSTMAGEPYPLMIPGCSLHCPVDLWASLLSDVIPHDWDRECYRPDPVRDHYYIMALTGLSCIFGVSLTLLVGWVAGLDRCYRRYKGAPGVAGDESREPLLTEVTVAAPQYGSFDRKEGTFHYSVLPRCL